MNYGFVIPSGDVPEIVEMAAVAENAGWDGFFVWEPVWGIDAWVCLAAAAMRTTRIRLGTMITPVSRMRPWKLAGETMSVDRLSNGRVILSVGLGAVDTGFEQVGEEVDKRTRAELLDEGLAIITGLWHGQPFQFDGQHYQIKPIEFMLPPPPVQQPRIPIWVVGAWPYEKSMQRVLRYDGLLPNVMDENRHHRPATPQDLREMVAYVAEHRESSTPFDFVIEGTTPGDDPAGTAEIVQPWQEAGATWWIEALWSAPRDETGRAQVRRRVQQGPPVI